MTDIDEPVNLNDFEPPERPDFRRVGRWQLPHVMSVESNKRVIYRRSSTAGKVLDDESNLTDWKLRSCVAGAAQRPELMALAATFDIDLNKKELRDIAEQCLVAGKAERRSITGTAVHAMFDHLDRGDEWTPPPQFTEICNAYQTTLNEWGLIPEEIEIHCVSDQWKLAGKMDRRYRTTKVLIAPDGMIIPIGSYVVGDTKTGRELEYAAGSYCTQIAAYVQSMRYDVQTDERTPFDPPSLQNWALIIHADSAGTRVDVYWVDLIRGTFGLNLADEVRRWRRQSDLLIIADVSPTPAKPPDLTAPTTAEPPGLAPVVGLEPRNLAARHEYLQGRVRALIGHSDVAAKALQRQWPRGIPGLKHDGHSWEDLDAIEWAVGSVEWNHAVPEYPKFVDPDLERSKANHPTATNWVQPTREVIEPKPDIQTELNNHPRAGLIRRWLSRVETIDYTNDTIPLAKALMSFAAVNEDEWPDDDLTVMLDGSLRAIGYGNGCKDLGIFRPEDAKNLLTAAFAVAAGNASLLFDNENQPVVRTSVTAIEWRRE